MADMIEPGRSGLLYRDDDVETLARACRRLHEDREFARGCGLEARALYRDELGPEPALHALLAALDSVSRPTRA